MRTLTQQLDQRSCKTACPARSAPLHPSSFSSSQEALLLSPPQGTIPSRGRPLSLVLRSSPPHAFLLSRAARAEYFLGTYDRPRVVLFCLAAWAREGGTRGPQAPFRRSSPSPSLLPRSRVAGDASGCDSLARASRGITHDDSGAHRNDRAPARFYRRSVGRADKISRRRSRALRATIPARR